MILRPPISTLFPYTTLFRSPRPTALVNLHSRTPEIANIVGCHGKSRLGGGPGAARRPDRRADHAARTRRPDRKSTRLNSSHPSISYAVFCLKKKNNKAIKLI